MPEKASLRYLPAAQDDLTSILEFIAKDSPSRAVTFIDRLDEPLDSLSITLSLGESHDIPNSESTVIVFL
jgi:plasmid stabilization system protein ParE